MLGLWTTCANFGNILGALIAHGCRDVAGISWEWTYNISGLVCAGFAVLILLFLVDHPSKVGLEVKELEEPKP